MNTNAYADRERTTTGTDATIRHYVPGGCEYGGGIGRLVGYICGSANQSGRIHFVTDTRGSRWSVAMSPVRLLAACLVMAKDRVTVPARIHHIHVAGRGSTSRKLILTQAARLLGCSHILHLHDYDYASDFAARSPWKQTLIRRMFQKADRVVALGQRDRMTLVTRLGVDKRRVVVARNCVPDPGAHNAQVNETPLIVFLGQLSERKGVKELLLALSRPIMKKLQWRAVLAGDGPVESYLRQAADLCLSDQVKMPGWLDVEQTRALCAQADILVLPSHAEGMAMAVIEGLAHGLAVVTTRVGAHDEVISDGETGLFVPVGDENALAETLARLVAHPEIRKHLSSNGRARYLSEFSMKAYMKSLDKLYEAVSTQHLRTVGAQ